jgi:hypothetical protein
VTQRWPAPSSGCGRPSAPAKANVDHMIPWPEGRTRLDNLVTACGACNKAKGLGEVKLHSDPACQAQSVAGLALCSSGDWNGDLVGDGCVQVDPDRRREERDRQGVSNWRINPFTSIVVFPPARYRVDAD